MQRDSASRISRVSAEYLPGTEGVWIFVFIDMMIFLMIFFVFMSEKQRHLELYIEAQRHLNEIFGLVNTLLLLTSSWMIAESVRAARNGVRTKVARQLACALLAGGGFALSKLIEYHGKIAAGITPATNSFFTFYFFITIVHFLHVLVGSIFIFHFWRHARSQSLSHPFLRGLENVGLYWHFVDVLWIFIFPLLYLVGRQ